MGALRVSGELRAFRVTDRDAWNRFVEAAPYHAFPQLWEWGELRTGAGWKPVRVAVGTSPDEPLAGVQLLLRPMPMVGWHLAYAPRGPIGQLDDPPVRDALVAALRSLGRAERIATVRADPEVGIGAPFGAALMQRPWHPAAKVQPPITRVIDLSVGEESLRAALRRKHRQYVNKAERDGVTVEWFDGSASPDVFGPALADFNRIYRLTARRAGFVARDPAYYERVWATFASGGRVRMSFALIDGERVATLFHFLCGDRVVESYGGMTDAGAESRANYLLKWAAIAGFAREGFATYDLWGLATGGIRQFKEGFGGSEVSYVGARDLRLSVGHDLLLRAGLMAYSAVGRTRIRVRGDAPPPAVEGP